MESRVTFLGHPLHAMLVVFPLGLLFTSFLFDLIQFWKKDPFWARGAFWMIAVGEAGAVAAAITGLLDYLSIPMPPHARQAATAHLFVGLTVVVVYALQLWLRRRHAGATEGAARHSLGFLFFAFLCFSAVGAQGYLGGAVSHVHGVGVTAERNRPDAPPPAPAAKSDGTQAVSGPEIFRRVCAGCHGTSGEGGMGPRLANTGHPHEIEEIEQIVRNGKPPMMPAFNKNLTAGEISGVAAHVRSLMAGGKNESSGKNEPSNAGHAGHSGKAE